MNPPSLSTEPQVAPASLANMTLCALLLGAVWAELVLKLHTDWATNPQYGFGDFVPAFIIFLLALRWRDRPAVAPKRGLLPAACALLLVLLPLRIVQEANADWRLLTWLHAAIVVGFTFLTIGSAGGFRFARHFLVPLMLIFVAIPWPLWMEQSAIAILSLAVARGTTAVLGMAGISAFQDGILIHLAAGDVRVEDACSGIRSLSGTLMAAVFIGEFYRLTTRCRAALLVGGVAVALVLNFLRALFLTWTASINGGAAIARWHDSAGLLIFGVSFAILWFTGDRLQNIRPAKPAGSRPEMPVLRPAFLIAAGLWLLAVEIATASWFHKAPASEVFNPVWPREDAQFKRLKLSDQLHSLLRFNNGFSALYNPGSSPPWQVFYLQWQPGRAASQLASTFRPELCLPEAGLKLIAKKTPLLTDISTRPLTIQCAEFRCDGAPLYVFSSLLEGSKPRLFTPLLADRLQNAWLGRRNLGLQIFQFATAGPPTFEQAQENFLKELPRLLQLVPGS